MTATIIVLGFVVAFAVLVKLLDKDNDDYIPPAF